MNTNSQNSTNERARIRTILNSIPEERHNNAEYSVLEIYYKSMGGDVE